MKSKSFLFLLSSLFLFFGCGKTKKYTTTDISFNFKSNINANSPQRFVLFAHNETRLEKARVLVPGSNNLTLPNGLWKFSVIGFEDTSSNSSIWPFVKDSSTAKPAYCGFTDFFNFNGTPQNISITVSNNNCNLPNFTISSLVNVYALIHYYQWILPLGDRDDINSENDDQQTFMTSCGALDDDRIYLPKNVSADKKLPYFLVLRIFKNANCTEEIGDIEFDGDIYAPPTFKWTTTPRASGLFYISFGADSPIPISIPAYQ
jgi:hypothetical protein